MQYDKTFKEEEVRLSDKIGLKKIATQLGISYSPYPDGVTNAINMDRMLFQKVAIILFRDILKSNVS